MDLKEIRDESIERECLWVYECEHISAHTWMSSSSCFLCHLICCSSLVSPLLSSGGSGERERRIAWFCIPGLFLGRPLKQSDTRGAGDTCWYHWSLTGCHHHREAFLDIPLHSSPTSSIKFFLLPGERCPVAIVQVTCHT